MVGRLPWNGLVRRMAKRSVSSSEPLRRLALVSPKGGSGKTVLAATAAAFLHALGFRVLVVDTDSATNGMTLLFLKEVVAHATGKGRGKARGVYDGFSQDSNGKPATPLTPFCTSHGFDLLPASFSLDNEVEQTECALVESLKELSAGTLAYDFVLLDAQAGSEAQSAVASSPEFSDVVVVVSEFDPMSIAGIDRLKRADSGLTHERTWILFNKVLPEFADDFGEIFEVFRYLPPIPWDADVVRSYARRRLALDMEHGNAFTLAVLRTMRMLLEDHIGTKIDAWASRQRSTLVEPISTQYADAMYELEGLLREQQYREVRAARRRSSRWALVAAGISVLAVMIGFAAFDSYFISRQWLFTVIAATVPVLITMGVQTARSVVAGDRLSPEEKVEQSRIERRIALLNEKLSKLEALQESDLASLMQHK